MFETWKFGGLTYLAFAMEGGYGIVDESGRWFGAWQTTERFRKDAREQGPEALKIGMRALTVRLV